jgi:hypothetical protein
VAVILLEGVVNDNMHANELQNIARRMSNQCWCRHWLYFNHPQNPVKMAVQCIECSEDPDKGLILYGPFPVPDLERCGFKIETELATPDQFIYTIDRTNEDGTPYISQL